MKSKICSLLREIAMLYRKAEEIYEPDKQNDIPNFLCDVAKKIDSLKKQLDTAKLKYSLHYTLPASKSIFNLVIYSKDKDARLDDCMLRLDDKYIFVTGSFFAGIEDDLYLDNCYNVFNHDYSHIVSDFLSIIDLFYVFSERLKEFYYDRVTQGATIDGISKEANDVLEEQEKLMRKLEARYNVEIHRYMSGVLSVIVKVRNDRNFQQYLHVVHAVLALDAYREVDVTVVDTIGIDKGVAIEFQIELRNYVDPNSLLEKVTEVVSED